MRSLATILSLAVLFGGGAWAAKPTADEPLQKGLDFLEKGDFPDAEKWFSITRRDFSGTDQGKQALVHETFLVVSRELSSLKLSSLYRETAEWQKVEAGASAAHKKRGREYEDRALRATHETEKLARAILAMERTTESLQFVIGHDGLEVEDLRAKVKKGEILDEKETARLERGEFLVHYLGLVSTVLQLPDQVFIMNPYAGKISWPVLFNALGTRLIIASHRAPDSEKQRVAKLCLERVMALTADSPYANARLEAQVALEKLSSDPSRGSVRVCPVCKKGVQAEWKFCPIDGTKI